MLLSSVLNWLRNHTYPHICAGVRVIFAMNILSTGLVTGQDGLDGCIWATTHIPSVVAPQIILAIDSDCARLWLDLHSQEFGVAA